jgi:aminotransferase
MSGSRSPRSRVAEHIARLPRSGIRDFFEIVNNMDGVISLGIGEPDFVTPWTIREATIYALEKGHTSYTSNLGLLSLRRVCCNYVEENFGVRYQPEKECIITVGVSEALDLVMRALLNPGDEVLYHEPCYVAYAPAVAMAHGVPVPVFTKEENAFALKASDLADKITDRSKVLLLNFPNNPTGANLSCQDKEEIARLAVKHDLIVVTDEIYAELTYGDRSPTIAAFPGMKERTVFLHGFSKAYAMTGYRVGYACGPVELIEAMMKVHQYTMLCASGFAQEAAMEALKGARKAMLSMREEYCQRRNVIVKKLNEMGLDCVMPEGAFYVFPSIRKTGLTSKEFATRLLNEKYVAVVPGTAFGTQGEGYVRCAYAASMSDIDIAMERMRDFVGALK